MTLRAVTLGFLGAAFVCAVTFYNDMIIRGTFLVGSYLPASVFGSLLVVVLVLNPLLRRLRASAALQARELAVITAMVLFACSVPGRGLMHHLTTLLMLPHHSVRTTPAWHGDPSAFTTDMVVDWDALATVLATDGPAADHPVRSRLRRHVRAPSGTPHGPAAPPASPAAAERQRLLDALNEAVRDRELPSLALPVAGTLPRHVRHQLPKALAPRASEEVIRRVNRGLIDTCLQGIVTPRKPSIVEQVPAVMLADADADTARALNGFVNGLSTGDAWLAPTRIPWSAWTRTLAFWVPLILTTTGLVIGLALVIHRQWAVHEKLPYPVVQFVHALLPTAQGRCSPVLRNRLFWTGAIPVFLVYMNNYAATWWPQHLIPIRTSLDVMPVLRQFPVFERSGVHMYALFHPSIYFSVVGIAYFLATDAAFSLGLAPYAYALVTGIIATYGITVGGPFLRPSVTAFSHAGGYCAMFLVLLYTGRHYYSNVCRRCLGLPTTEAVPRAAAWGGRTAGLMAVLMVAQLVAVGLDVALAVLYVLGAVVIFVVISRLLAEVGVFRLQPFFYPCVLLWGLLGVRAIGPDQLLVMGLVSSALLVYPRAATMPFVVCALELADRVRQRVGTVAVAGFGAFSIGLAVAIPVTLYIQYQYGAIRAGDGWTHGVVPRLAFDASCAVRTDLAAQGILERTLAAGAWQRLTAVDPVGPCLVAFLVVFLLTWCCALLRHRFSRWPIHPVMFLVLASWQSTYIAFSFLLGWAIKAAITKYGGAVTYQRVRPVMIGVIAGELLAGGLPILTGTLYYLVTGTPPPPFGFR